MSAVFEIPEWLPRAAPPAPPPPVDEHRIEGLVNRFIAGKQEALFTAPDAFYRLDGADALDGQSAIAQRLRALRSATLDQARDDGERAALGPRLDLHLDDAMDGIGRHVAGQRTVWQRQVIAERQRLIQRAAELEHDNDDKIAALAEANASAATERARLDGIAPNSPEESGAARQARSQVLRTAISERIANRKGTQALALFDRVKDGLSHADLRRLDVPIEVARNEAAVDAWLQRETDRPGEPLIDRIGADSTLTPYQKANLTMQVAAQESARESDRVATVLGLDDDATAAARTLATQPTTYRAGTFASLAEAYAGTGEATKANEMRRAALQEPMLRAFALSSPDHQQALVDLLPEDDRMMAHAIQHHQAEASDRERDRQILADEFAQALDLIEPPASADPRLTRVRSNAQVVGLEGSQELAQADDLVTPRGFTYERAPPELDPARLNRPLPKAEQQEIAVVLGKLVSRNFADLGLHRYENRPHQVTGAVLPPSQQGYLAVDVPNADLDRGATRVIIDRSTGKMYYTNNHYKSFFPLRMNPRPD